MRTPLLLAAIVVIGGCAGQPSTTPPAAATTAATATGQPEQTVSDSELEKRRLAEAIKRGYKVVNSNGEELYCRSDFATGSHIQKNTVCLTAQQLDDLDRRNQRDLGMPNTPINSPIRTP